MSIKHFIVVHPHIEVLNRDIELVFGPIDRDDEIIEVESDDLALMAVAAGLFPSNGQSRKNGLAGPAPHGLWCVGTRKRRFWVWNPGSPSGKVVLSPSFDKTSSWFQAEDE